MDHKTVEEFILGLPDATLDYPFGKDVAVYKVHDKMFALIAEGKNPVQISLKCDCPHGPARLGRNQGLDPALVPVSYRYVGCFIQFVCSSV